MRTFAILATLCFSYFTLIANATSLNSAALEHCMDEAVSRGAFINVQRMECLKVELKKQDDQLNTIYKVQFNQLKPDERRWLQKGQRQWILYRDAWCRFEKSLVDMAPNFYVNELYCLVDLTFQQVQRLKQTLP